MKAISLRMRLTLIIVLLITILATILTITNMYNANTIFAGSTTYIAKDTEYADSVNEATTENVDEFSSRGLILMVVVILVGGVLAYIVLGIGLRPIKVLSSQISKISENNLATRITDFHAGDEIDTLAESFNGMLDRIESAFDSQRKFASAAAHELKTPLTTIKTNLDVLKIAKDPSKEKYTEVFSAIENQNQRMIYLVEDLFAVSMQREYTFNDKVELKELFLDILMDLQNKANDMEIEITVENHIQDMLQCNAIMIRRAMSNIVENSIKYNQKGGKVLIDLIQQGNMVKITVSDTGIGISAEHREHIFDAFYRVDTSRSRKIAGSGLGLAIVKDTVTKHGGDIQVYPVASGGSAFVVSLPLIK